MRNYRAILLLFLISVFSFTFFVGCSEDESVNEYDVLLSYLEETDFINTYAPALKSAEAVHSDILTHASQYLIDIRSAAQFEAGHIDGAVRVDMKDLLDHVEAIADDYESIVIICVTGQTAAYATSLLRLMGYDNVVSMKFGMSSWNPDLDSWSANCASTYFQDFETTLNAIGPAEEPPVLDTGKKSGASILKKRVETMLEEGFGEAAISASVVVPNASNYYIINYWPQAQYLDPGHIPGAYCYEPANHDLRSDKKLNTIPADQTVVIYCYKT